MTRLNSVNVGNYIKRFSRDGSKNSTFPHEILLTLIRGYPLSKCLTRLFV